MNKLFNAVGAVLSAMVPLMCLSMTLTVVLRYFLGIGSVALQEVGIYLHGTVIMLGAGYTLVHDGHVRVDIFYRSWSRIQQARIDVIGTLLLLLPFAVFVSWSSSGYVASSWALLEGSPEAGGLPGVFVLKTMIPAMGLLLLAGGWVRVRALWPELKR